MRYLIAVGCIIGLLAMCTMSLAYVLYELWKRPSGLPVDSEHINTYPPQTEDGPSAEGFEPVYREPS